MDAIGIEYKIYNVPGDGDCMLHAIIAALQLKDVTPDIMRRELWKHMESNDKFRIAYYEHLRPDDQELFTYNNEEFIMSKNHWMDTKGLAFFEQKYNFIAFVFLDDGTVRNANAQKSFETGIPHQYTINEKTRCILLKLDPSYTHYNYIKIKLPNGLRFRSRFKFHELQKIPFFKMHFEMYKDVYPTTKKRKFNYDKDIQALLNIENQLRRTVNDVRKLINESKNKDVDVMDLTANINSLVFL
jgi:hypothetical protein